MKKLGESVKTGISTITSNKWLMYGVMALVLIFVFKKVFKKKGSLVLKSSEKASDADERLLNTSSDKPEKVSYSDNDFKKFAITLENTAKGWFLGYGENDRKMRKIFKEAINNLADFKRFNVIYKEVNKRSLIDMVYQEYKFQKYINAYNLILLEKGINFIF